jgi:drug/metabolite transporter (DMT)-like permease
MHKGFDRAPPRRGLEAAGARSVAEGRLPRSLPIAVAYLGVILIWSTTPLAIKWSSEGAGVLFGAASRMALGLAFCLLVLMLLQRGLPRHPAARRTYLAGGLGIWGAMSATYWASQFIPSGLMSVLFGLTPVITGLLAALLLGERALTPSRLLGLGFALMGLALVFLPGLLTTAPAGELGRDGMAAAATGLGVGGMLIAVLIHSASAVWVKRISAKLPALETTTGALVVAVPLFTVSWLLFERNWPFPLEAKAGWSILYLALAGSVVAFSLYYHLLRHLSASRVALIPLVTPLLALALGHWLNAEAFSVREILGSLLILLGLSFWQWGVQLRRLLLRRLTRSPPVR